MNQRERNRKDFPQLAGMVDEFRRIFGPDVKLVAGIERGREVGKVDDKLRRTYAEECE